MDAYLADMIQQRRETPHDDLLTSLIAAEVNGEKLSQKEILGFNSSLSPVRRPLPT
jgi:cytochrome P450